MTSSSHCAVCRQLAYNFVYNEPRLDPDSINDGKWLCGAHLPPRPLKASEVNQKPKSQVPKLRKKLW
jgi:hypothetical protein